MAKLLQYHRIVWVFVILLIVTGIFTYMQLPKRELPEINSNVATVSTVYPGATPIEVERTITNPIESELLSIKGIEEVTSSSSIGFGSITAIVSGDADKSTVHSKIRQVVSDVSRGYPEEVKDTEVDTDVSISSVASYNLLADSRDDLYNLQEDIETWRSELTQITGVDSILVKGLPEQKVSISVNNEQIQQYQLSPFQIIEKIQAEMAPAAIGTEEQNKKIYQMLLNKYSDIEGLNNLPLATEAQGKSITIRDIGEVSITNKEVEDLISYHQQPALSLTVLAKEGVNISSLQEKISQKIKELEAGLPSSITVNRLYTQSTIISEVFTNLIGSFSISLIAVLIIMILGLPFSSAILVALSIPISIITGLIPLPYVGVDLNQISVIGMIIAIGILVDDAIVVNDNIQRRFQLGDSPLEGTINGVREVGISIITSTLMIIFSFFPLTFLSGSNGDFIRALPSVLIFTVTASTIIALILIPTVQYVRYTRYKKPAKTKVGILARSFNGLAYFYAGRILPKITKKPWKTSLLGIVLCTLLALLVFRIPFEFFPAADRPEVTISVEYPQGTPIEETHNQLKKMEEFLLNNNDQIADSSVYTGTGLPNLFSSGLKRSGENTGQLLVRVDRTKTSATDFIKAWEEPLRKKFSNAEIFLETIVSGPPPSAPVQVQVQGQDIGQLTEEARNIQTQLLNIDQTEIASVNAGYDQPFINYKPDRDFMADNNISINQVSSLIQLANTGMPLGTMDNGIKRMPLEIILADGDKDGVDLEALKVRNQSSTNPDSSPIPLNEFVSREETEQIGMIPHLDGKRTLTIKAYPKEGENQEFSKKAVKVINKIKGNLPEGYSLVQSGETNARTEFFIEVSKLFFIVLFLIYLTIAIQFNSLLMPLLITGTVFLAITGAIIGLFISGQPLSFLAVLGIVSLSGIVVRNSVILIDFIEQNKKFYYSEIDAVIEAGRARIRPILLTSLTSIVALIPIIFTGDVLFKPLAVSIVSGLAFSTVLTLLLVPAFYLIIFSKKTL